MTVTVRACSDWLPVRDAHAPGASRDEVIDTMRGIAILMVIGIHSLQQPLDAGWAIAIDAALRPCVPIFLFASGYLTALSGRVPLAKRLKAALIPYAIAFVAAYVYMALHNPAMDHRPITTLARFGLAYVFVYYYVFVYIGCTVVLVADLRDLPAPARPEPERQLARFPVLAIGFGLIAGSYLDPLLSRLGFPDSADRGSPHARYSVLVYLHGRVGALIAAMSEPAWPIVSMRGVLLERDADRLRHLCGGAPSRHRRRRRLRFDRLLRLLPRCSAFCSLARAAQDASARHDRLGQLLHLSLAHLHRHDACAITQRCVSSALFRILRLPMA